MRISATASLFFASAKASLLFASAKASPSSTSAKASLLFAVGAMLTDSVLASLPGGAHATHSDRCVVHPTAGGRSQTCATA